MGNRNGRVADTALKPATGMAEGEAVEEFLIKLYGDLKSKTIIAQS